MLEHKSEETTEEDNPWKEMQLSVDGTKRVQRALGAYCDWIFKWHFDVSLFHKDVASAGTP